MAMWGDEQARCLPISGVWCLVSNARWLRTGDEVKFDAKGNIFITDRIKVRSVQPLSHDFYLFV